MEAIFPVVPGAFAIEILDGLACALLAAAAACRARGFGAHMAGAIVLGCLCGLVSPVLREILIHGHEGARMTLNAMPDDAFIGAMAGVVATMIMPGKKYLIFFWLDACGLALASSLAAVLAVPLLGIVGALTLGVICGLAPGTCRDVAMGDIAMMVERNWYAAAAAIGCMASMTLLALAPYWAQTPFMRENLGVWSITGGALLAVVARIWKDNGPAE